MKILKDKYSPNSLDEYILNSKLKIWKNSFDNNNLSNIVIYGPKGCGKYKFALCILKDIYGDRIYNLRKNIIKYEVNNSIKDFEILSSSFHYEIYLNNYILNNKTALINIIKELCKTKNISTDAQKIILIKNGDYISQDNYSILKTISEIYHETIKFIITFENISKLSLYYRGLFTFIRVPSPTIYEIKQFIKNIAFKENIVTTDEQINEIIEISGRDISKLYNVFELSYIDKKYTKYKDVLQHQINIIIDYINSCNVNKILEIRKHIYELMSKNIIKKYIFHRILKYYLNCENLNFDIKQKIVSSAANYEHRTVDGYRSIIHVEAWCVYLMKLLNDNKVKF